MLIEYKNKYISYTVFKRTDRHIYRHAFKYVQEILIPFGLQSFRRLEIIGSHSMQMSFITIETSFFNIYLNSR